MAKLFEWQVSGGGESGLNDNDEVASCQGGYGVSFPAGRGDRDSAIFPQRLP